ncbi:MAG TPA: hypothetical protein VFV12_08755 [Xanthobacteraceae bacterium]|nr:hypothetical protein [Xanthobacteraceae bacterium]
MKKPLPQTAIPPASPAVYSNDAAAFVVFDGCHAFGALNGLLQLELYANTQVPMTRQTGSNGNDVRTKPIVIAHLRGTRLAVEQLRAAIDRALEMDKAKQ